MRHLFVVAALIGSAVSSAVCASPVTVATSPISFGGYVPPLQTPELLAAGYRNGLMELRSALLRQKAADGGALTPEHVAVFQRKLDKLNDLHRRVLADANIYRISR